LESMFSAWRHGPARTRLLSSLGLSGTALFVVRTHVGERSLRVSHGDGNKPR
jgi:hypothetical protein